jgi:hypothetical protein
MPRYHPSRPALRALLPVLVAAVFATSAPVGVRADDPPAPAAPTPAAPPAPTVPVTPAGPPRLAGGPGFEVRIFDVRALTAGRSPFRCEAGPFPLAPEGVDDENRPQFGEDANEGSRPFGSIDDVVDLIRQSDPPAFSVEGVVIAAYDSRRLVVSAPTSTQERVAAHLADLERIALGAVTIDVVVFRGDASAVGEGGVAGAVARGALVPLAGARSAGFAPSVVAGRAGGEFAFVQDEDVEVAIDSKGADPIVGLAKSGVSFDAELLSVRPTRVTATLRAWWAAPGAPRRTDLRPGLDPVEVLDTEGRSIETVLDLVPGVWSLHASTGDIVFGARATVRPHEGAASGGIRLGTPSPISSAGPLGRRLLDVADLCARIQDVRGTSIHLRPTHWTPPEPPELKEPAALLPAEGLVETVRSLVDPAYWETEGAAIEIRQGRLDVRADEAHLAAVGELLDRLRASAGLTTRVRATLVRLPLASIPEYLSGLDDGATLLADGGAALLARRGATIVDRAGVRCRPGQRAASVGGTSRRYVADFDVEIAQEAFIGNPIVRSALDGLSFDVTARPVGNGASVALEVRVDRGSWLGSRQVTTPHGEIECPSLGVSTTYGSTLVPLGGRRILGAALYDGFVTLTIVGAAAD